VTRSEEDLRATAEDIAEDANELKEVEEEKTRLESDDPRLLELSGKGERIARRLHQKTVVERELAEEVEDTARKRRLD
jgi:hypothetical protein